jgi:dTMP kinase
MIAAIVGADGAGKSTVVRAIRERLGAHTRVIDRWDIVGDPQEYPTADFIKPDKRYVRTCTALMSPEPRLLFLLWTSIASVAERRTADPAGSVVLLDGYWMKHAASEIAYGLDQWWVEQIVAGLPGVDIVIYLRSDPETAWSRISDRVVPYECAMDLTCVKSSFIGHQQKIHDVFDKWAAWPRWVTLDARRPLDDVAEDAIQHIQLACRRTL